MKSTGKITLPCGTFSYTLEKRKRMKNVRLHLKEDGTVVVRMPWHVPYLDAEKFIREKSEWIAKTQTHLDSCLKISCQEPRPLIRAKSQRVIRSHIDNLNTEGSFNVKGIRLRKLRSQWGNCKTNGWLCFRDTLGLLPPELSEYVVAHELCHLKEFNHSRRFWCEVERLVPDYRQRRAALRNVIIEGE